MTALNKLNLLLLVHLRSHIAVVTRDLCESCQDMELGNYCRYLFEEWVVGGGNLQHLLNKFILLDLVLLFKLTELADEVFQTSTCEAHDSILER